MITTASTPVLPGFRDNHLLHILIVGYLLLWIIMAIDPLDRFDWFLENLLVFAFAAVAIVGYRRLPLSNISNVMIFLFMGCHAFGSHYTYAETPIGFWARDLLELERNHFDRVVHFLFGFLIFYPCREVVIRGIGVVGFWAGAFGFLIVNSMSHIYETVEWLAAIILDPHAALAFLGTQGDVFDAQKDTTLAMAGALLAWGLTVGCRRVWPPRDRV